MKNLLLLWLKKVHFTFENNIFQQKVGAAMGSPFGPVLVGIFMVHLEKTLCRNYRNLWNLGKDI